MLVNKRRHALKTLDRVDPKGPYIGLTFSCFFWPKRSFWAKLDPVRGMYDFAFGMYKKSAHYHFTSGFGLYKKSAHYHFTSGFLRGG